MSPWLRSALAGAVIGLPVLGVGGRSMMRIIAHWEGRVPVFTATGSLNVVMFGTLAGVAAGVIHGFLKRFIQRTAIRLPVFLAICVALALRGTNELLLRPRLLFVAITLVYGILVELATRREYHRPSGETPATIRTPTAPSPPARL